jgi:hypothetical protein
LERTRPGARLRIRLAIALDEAGRKPEDIDAVVLEGMR